MELFQPKLILFPTDFSEPATLALYYGKHLADCFNGRLVVLYADSFSPPPYFTSGQVEELAKEIGHFKRAAREHLTRYVTEQIGRSTGESKKWGEMGLSLPWSGGKAPDRQ